MKNETKDVLFDISESIARIIAFPYMLYKRLWMSACQNEVSPGLLELSMVYIASVFLSLILILLYSEIRGGNAPSKTLKAASFVTPFLIPYVWAKIDRIKDEYDAYKERSKK